MFWNWFLSSWDFFVRYYSFWVMVDFVFYLSGLEIFESENLIQKRKPVIPEYQMSRGIQSKSIRGLQPAGELKNPFQNIAHLLWHFLKHFWSVKNTWKLWTKSIITQKIKIAKFIFHSFQNISFQLKFYILLDSKYS